MRKLTSALISFLTMIVILATFSGVVSADDKLDGWQFIDGYWYYYYNGEPGTGRWIINDSNYYFDYEDGHMYTGWLDGEYYKPNGAMAIGWTLIEDNWYFFNQYGEIYSGWLASGGKTYYILSSGLMATGTQVIDGVTYPFDSSGAFIGSASGFTYDENGVYYFKNNNMVTGWYYIDGYWYYFDKYGYMIIGVEKIDEKTYCFDNNGRMVANGWCYDGFNWYYVENNHPCGSGWQNIGGTQYYFYDYGWDFGILAADTVIYVGDYRCIFDSNGHLVTGWYFVEDFRSFNTQWTGGWFYGDEDGHAVTGWKKLGGQWYYFKKDSAEMYFLCRAYIDGYVYGFEFEGYMVTGWDSFNGKWYYYESDGRQCDTGWKQIGGTWYYFEPDTYKGFGVMSEGWKEIDGITYYLDNGAMATGWKKIDGVWYFFESYGAMVTNGWKQLGGVWYFFDENGEMLTGKHTLGDKTYVFDDNGHWIS